VCGSLPRALGWAGSSVQVIGGVEDSCQSGRHRRRQRALAYGLLVYLGALPWVWKRKAGQNDKREGGAMTLTDAFRQFRGKAPEHPIRRDRD